MRLVARACRARCACKAPGLLERVRSYGTPVARMRVTLPHNWFLSDVCRRRTGCIMATQRRACARAELQRRILARMRALGMTPVLPAFAG